MLNVAIIGTGGIAPLHIKGYLTFKEDVNIVALCDIYPEKAEKMAADLVKLNANQQKVDAEIKQEAAKATK